MGITRAVARAVLALAGSLAIAACSKEPAALPPAPGPSPALAGSGSCRACHETFYGKWENSRHGRAMQVVTPGFVASLLAPMEQPIEVGGVDHRVDLSPFPPVVREEVSGVRRAYPLLHALGGKNVFYFLTSVERGRLQVAPLAFDVGGKRWFDATASMVRHVGETPVDWRDPLLTFNTSCHGCHVSQVETNYDPATDVYRTTWAEPGISCETCHNSAVEHVRVFREAQARGEVPPADPGLLSYKGLDPGGSSETCLPCHAKAGVLTDHYRAGERFLDHHSLVTLEDPDFHPDGRDLGENYTATTWLLGPCVRSGQLGCLHCHTSSGRYRFEGEEANRACAPCHAERVADAAPHHRHAPGGPGSRCVDCHMPRTSFARMVRSDHSMRPPMPAATIRFGSPNACNLCHTDRDAAWADREVRQWHAADYQAETLRWAGFVAAAREGNFPDLSAILAFLADRRRSPVVASSLARLLASCRDPAVDAALPGLLDDPDPLVRCAAAEALSARGGAVPALLSALDDGLRAVRLRAVAGLAGVAPESLPAPQRTLLEAVTAEYLASLAARPDHWDTWHNLGNWHLDGGRTAEAVRAFEKAAALRPDAEMPLVNAAIALARLGDRSAAEARLRRALSVRPDSAPAHFNLGLLLGEAGDRAGAERELRAALKADPRLDAAAVNLGILLAGQDLEEALHWCRTAYELRPGSERYAFTLGFYLRETGRVDEAMEVLREALRPEPPAPTLYELLGEILLRAGDRGAATEVYRRAAANPGLPPEVRATFEERMRRLADR
jgi:tetratricopeptide (TPR) repeat protein